MNGQILSCKHSKTTRLEQDITVEDSKRTRSYEGRMRLDYVYGETSIFIETKTRKTATKASQQRLQPERYSRPKSTTTTRVSTLSPVFGGYRPRLVLGDIWDLHIPQAPQLDNQSCN